MRGLVVAAVGLSLLAGSAHAAGPPVLGFSVSNVARPAAAVSLPSASRPNEPGAISIPPSFTTPPANPQQLPVSALHGLWQRAGYAYGIPWTVLAAINKIESNFGENMGPRSAGAIGWMQFMPDTWRMYGTDANNDGVASPWSSEDEIYSAARYLAASGAQTDLRRAVFAYNHAGWYVDEVMNLAAVYAAGGADLASAFTAFQVDLSAQKEQVAAA